MPPKVEVSATLHQGAVYRPSAELKIESCGAPTMLKEADEGMDCGEWEREFDSLERLRAVVVYASELLLKEEYAKEVLPKLMKRIEAQTNNLRSQIVKNALMLLEEMFRHLGKALDKFLVNLVPCVIKRCADQNKFLVEAAETTMASLLENCPSAKIVKHSFSSVQDKDQKIRTSGISAMAQAVSSLSPSDPAYLEMLDKLISTTGPMLYDNSEKARSSARQIITTLVRNAASTSTVAELKKSYSTLVPREYQDRFDKILTQEAPGASETPKAPNPLRKEQSLLKVPVKRAPPTPSAASTPSSSGSDDSKRKEDEGMSFYGVKLDSLEVKKDGGRRGSVDSQASHDSRNDPNDGQGRGRDKIRPKSPGTRKRSDSTESTKSTSSTMSTSSKSFFEPTLPDSFAVVYKAASELTIPADADVKKLLAKAVSRLGSGEWKEEFQALDDLRAVVVTQADLVESTQNRSDVVRKVHACVSNVRHCVIVNALMCLEDMFRVFKQNMDGYVAFLLPTIVKRVIDQKEKILSETAAATMTALTECSTPSRSLKLIYTMWTEDRNLATKNCCVKYAAVMLTRLGPAVAEKAISELVVTYVGPMMHDRQEEHRRHAKEMLVLLCNAHSTAGTSNDLKASVDKLVPDKFKDRAQTLITQALAGELPPEREPVPERKPIVTKPKTPQNEEPTPESKKKDKSGERTPLTRSKEELAKLDKLKEDAQSKRSSDARTLQLDFSSVGSKVNANFRTKEELAELDRQKEEAQKARANLEPATNKFDFSGVTSKVAPILRTKEREATENQELAELDRQKEEAQKARAGETPTTNKLDFSGVQSKVAPLLKKDEHPEVKPTPAPAAATPKSTVHKCPQCGAKTLGDAKFCSNCATKRVSLPKPVVNAGIRGKNVPVGLAPKSPSTAAKIDLLAQIDALAAGGGASAADDETF